MRKLLKFPFTFVAMNGAAFVGLYSFIRKRKDVWLRSSEDEPGEPTTQTSAARSEERLRKVA
ncbi:MAG TPA: hypothetical protein VIK48_00840 [Candidatus Manganitrophaceae bacterium]